MATPRQIRRRRRVAALAIGLVALGAIYLVLALTVLAPADRDGAEVVHLTVHSRDVVSDQGVQVVVPAADIDHTRGRPLLVFLHGHGDSDSTFIEDEAFFGALESLGRRAPVVAFPDGGEDSYWHDRATGRWGSYVTGEVIPAVGGHSPALWLEGGATAPGAFDDAEDFERNDVIGTVRADPEAFGPIPIWNDVGIEDPFLTGSVTFDEALAAGGADLSAHRWPGGHEESYWDRHWKQYLRFYARALESCGR